MDYLNKAAKKEEREKRSNINMQPQAKEHKQKESQVLSLRKIRVKWLF